MKKILLPVLLLLLALPMAGGAAAHPAASQAVTITERHMYMDGASQHMIPQQGAEQRHTLQRGASITLKTGSFPGFSPEGGETERRILAENDQEVIFVYRRITAPVTATVRLEATAASNLAFLRDRLSARNITLRARQETLATLSLVFTEEDADGLLATLAFDPVPTHSLGGTPLAYRVLMESPPGGFLATTDGLHLILRPAGHILSVRHLFESPRGMEPIPQPGAEYSVACWYGDTLLIPNQDFEGFLTDQETPNQYIAAVTGQTELSFFHRRRMGVYGQVEIDASRSNRPARLLRLIQQENPVLLSLEGKTVGSAVAQFTGQDALASVSFPGAYSHTPEGEPLAYTLSLAETPPGFLALEEGTTIVLTPRPVSVHVTHQYAASPGVWETIPQEGATETLQAFYGDALTVPGRAFAGFEEEPGDERTVPQVSGEEEVFFQHVRATGTVACTLRLAGGPDTNAAALLQELSLAWFTATGGELPAEGLRIPAEAAGEADAYLLSASLAGVPTHAPDGTRYAYALELRGFAPLDGVLQPFTDIAANAPVSADLSLPEVAVDCLLQEAGGEALPDSPLAAAYPYGEAVTLAPPEVPGYASDDAPLSIPFLREAVTHTFHYHRIEDAAVTQ